MVFVSTLGSTYTDYALKSGSGYNLVGEHMVSCNLYFIRLHIKAMSMRSSRLLGLYTHMRVHSCPYGNKIYHLLVDCLIDHLIVITRGRANLD